MTRKITTRLLSAVLSCILIALSIPFAVSSVYYDKADYEDVKNAELESMRQQLEDYEKLMGDIGKQLKDIESMQKDENEARALYLTMRALYEDQREQLEVEMYYCQTDKEKLQKDIADTQLEYDDAYSKFLSLLCMTYEEGSANYIEILLGATDFSDLLSRIERISGMMHYSDTLLERISEKKASLEKKSEELTAKEAELEAAILALDEKDAEIDKWEAQNAEALLQIEADIEKLIAENAEYSDKAAVLEALFQEEVDAAIAAENKRREEIAIQEELEEERRRQEALEEANRNKSFLWPLPAKWTYLSSTFGYRDLPELGYYNKFHKGIDIPAYAGTDIYASKAGYVLISKYHYSYGNYILLDHGDGTQTLYAHASKLYVKEGVYVDQGQVIAAVGTTGSSTGNHLHFEIRKDGNYVDPEQLLVKP